MKRYLKHLMRAVLLSITLFTISKISAEARMVSDLEEISELSGTGQISFTPDTSGLYKIAVNGLDFCNVKLIVSEAERQDVPAAYFIPDEGAVLRAYELEAGQAYEISYYDAPSGSALRMEYLPQTPEQPWLRKEESLVLRAGTYGAFRIPAGYFGDELSLKIGVGIDAECIELWTAGITNNYVHMDKLPVEIKRRGADTYLQFEGTETPVTVCVNQVLSADAVFSLIEGMDYSVKDISQTAAVEAIPDQKYTGRALVPTVRLSCDGELLQEGIDYTVSCRNNTRIGTAEMTIRGMGSYTGELKRTFEIVVFEGSSYTVGKQRYTVTEARTDGSGTVRLDYVTDKSVAAVKITPFLNLGGKNFKITEIRASAFKGCEQLKGVTIGNNVVTIGNNAFYGCTNLEYVIGAAYVRTIGDRAFYNCTSLMKYGNSNNRITAARAVSIGTDAFRNCTSAKYVNLSSKELASIGTRAFCGCTGVETLIVSKSAMNEIGSNAFYGIKPDPIFR